MSKATFVIAVYNDTPTLIETIENILETTEDVDIIVVDDANTIRDELTKYPLALYSNKERRGVGFSLDYGIRQSKTEIVFPMGCDIRFSGDWLPRFLEVTKANPKSLISTVCAGLNKDRKQITGKETHYHAAHILFRVTEKNNNRVLPFREYLESKWNNKMTGDVEEVGSALGAFYSLHKSWYEKISPWRFHKVWGSLEPLISMSYYMNGGNCLIDLKTVTGHIFLQASSTKPIKDLIYNKLLTAYLYLPRDLELEVFAWAKTLAHSEGAFQAFEKMKPELAELRKLKDSLSDEDIQRRLQKTGVIEKVMA